MDHRSLEETHRLIELVRGFYHAAALLVNNVEALAPELLLVELGEAVEHI